MPRYKPVCFDQDKFISINFSRQILPGTFEYTLSYLVDEVIDTSVFDAHYCNDDTGATAYDPSVLLTVVLYAYSRGIIRSREIAHACNKNILSCKARYFCPSCHQKRMPAYGDWVEDDVLAPVPHRQYVFALPKLLRPYFRQRR